MHIRLTAWLQKCSCVIWTFSVSVSVCMQLLHWVHAWKWCISESASAVKCVCVSLWASVTVTWMSSRTRQSSWVSFFCLVTYLLSICSTNYVHKHSFKAQWRQQITKSCLMLIVTFLFSSLFFVLGQGGQCRAHRGCLVAVAAAAAIVCMRVWSLALSPCPAHNAVVHAERGAKGPRAGWPLL